jgi:hypothetical protein
VIVDCSLYTPVPAIFLHKWVFEEELDGRSEENAWLGRGISYPRIKSTHISVSEGSWASIQQYNTNIG